MTSVWRSKASVGVGALKSSLVISISVTLLNVHACQPIGFTCTGMWRSGGAPVATAIGDLNDDGILDIVVANGIIDGGYSILFGLGRGGFAPPLNYDAGGGSPTQVLLHDLNADGKLDLLLGDRDFEGCAVLLGAKDGFFGSPMRFPSGWGSTFIVLRDLDGDSRVDLISAYEGGVSALLGNGDGTFGSANYYGTAGSPTSLAVDDFNGDGHADVAVASPGVGIGLYLGAGDGTLASAKTLNFSGQVESVISSDFNHDGIPDLATGTSVPMPGIRVLLGLGEGEFGLPQYYRSGGGLMVVEDFDNDGNVDIAVAGSRFADVAQRLSILLGWGDGTFQPGIPGNPISGHVSYGDLDADGKPDLVVAGVGWAGSIAVMKNAFLFPADPFGIDCRDNVLRVSWPASLTNAFLEATASLLPANWEPVRTPPTLQDGRWGIDLTEDAPILYFRLVLLPVGM